MQYNRGKNYYWIACIDTQYIRPWCNYVCTYILWYTIHAYVCMVDVCSLVNNVYSPCLLTDGALQLVDDFNHVLYNCPCFSLVGPFLSACFYPSVLSSPSLHRLPSQCVRLSVRTNDYYFPQCPSELSAF